MSKFDSDGVGYDAYQAVMAKREAQLVAMDAAQLEAKRELEVAEHVDPDYDRDNAIEAAEHARFNCGLSNNLVSDADAGLGEAIIYHEVDGQIVPLRVAEPGEIAAIEAASGLS